MTTTVAVLTGVVASLVASLFWLAATRRVRPKIEISPVVAELPQTSDPDRKARYQIKIINRSRRVATDLIFELVLLRPSREKGGEVKVRRPVEVLGPPPLLLAGYHRGDKDAHNAYRVSIRHDLRQWLTHYPNSSLRLRIAARDSVTGVGKVFEQTWFDPASELRRGRFAKGQTFEIVAET